MKAEKECEACGALFEVTHNNQKYCPKCRSNPELEKLKVREAQIRLAKMDGPELVEWDCEVCGRHKKGPVYLMDRYFHLTASSSYDGKEHFYCSNKCFDIDNHTHTNCENCGKSLEGNDYNPASFHHFCCQKCEVEFKAKKLAENGFIHKCVNCGKQFVRNSTTAYFCSHQCHLEARSKGWKSPEAVEKAKKAELEKTSIVLNCSECGKKFRKTFKNRSELLAWKQGVIDDKQKGREVNFFCSRACAGTNFKRAREEAKKAREEQKKQEVVAKQKKSQEQNDICARCKVSYKDCERMQSEFRIIPKGAHYNENGKLVECPKFKE